MTGIDEINRAFARLLATVRELRQQCPWDREQTVQSLAKHLVEESYEALDAIDNGGSAAITDELGDVITQALAIGVIAEEEQRLSIAGLLEHAESKLIRRHPHVYGGSQADTADDVVANWNQIKQEELRKAGASSALDGIARALPALSRAQKLGSRARQAGLDWRDVHEVLAKVREEIDEVEGALSRNDPGAAAEEIGDMLLAIANAPRFIGHDAEETLRKACDKFSSRFKIVERLTAERGLDLKQLSSSAIEALWQEAKRIRYSESN
ncbi:MAG: nucleoside triphosphate pyrophosphohydrolase [Candidatus Binataceae bacterium]|jgi:MazG family protein